MNLSGYLGELELSIKTNLAYKTEYFLTLFFMFVQVLLMIFIWTAIYLGTKVTVIKGLTLPGIYLYFLVVYALRNLMNMNLPYSIQDSIFDGSITAEYTRPINYPLQKFFYAFGQDLLSVCFVSIPLLVIMFFIAHIALNIFSVVAFAVEVILAYAILSVLGFLLGMLAIKFVYVASAIELTWLIILLLGGGVVPLNFFPAPVQRVLMALPFAIILYVPAATFLGIISNGTIMFSIEISTLWLIALLVIAYFMWGRARKLIASARG